jgi:hypothetical protein
MRMTKDYAVSCMISYLVFAVLATVGLAHYIFGNVRKPNTIDK